MIIVKSKQEIEVMRESGKVTGFILRELENYIKPGMSTMDIDKFVESTIQKYKMIPTFKGYGGFPGNACVSVNEELIHGIPSKKKIIKDGDIVSVDVGSTFKGYVTDAARTYLVGNVDDEVRRLVQATKDSFFEGLKFCKEGFRLSDVSHAIQSKVEGEGFFIVKDFVGHGVGKNLHEDPQIPNHGKPGRGPRLVAGMTLAIEPMTSIGDPEVDTLLDNWTVVTVSGKYTAHYENTVVITDGEPELLTL